MWRNEAELLRTLDGVHPQLLENHSAWALSHFEQFHSVKVLFEAVNDTNIQVVGKISKLRKYYPDRLQTFLEDIGPVDSKIQLLSNEIERVKLDYTHNLFNEIERVNSEWSAAIKVRDQNIHDLDEQLCLIYRSRSWKFTAPLREVKKFLASVGFIKK